VWELVGGGIQSFNIHHAGNEAYKRLCYALYAPDQSVAGGVIGEMLWDWLYINLLFIKEELRSHGYGSWLLASIEAEARSRGARHTYLDTFSFQAPEFYLKHGYRVFGELQNFPPGHQRYFLTKELSEIDSD
jgi:GNAT superfamily N-acetyltransferase